MDNSDFMDQYSAEEKKRLNFFGRVVYSPFVQGFILVCIVLNSIQLGLDTSPWWRGVAGDFSKWLDTAFLWIFVIEIVFKLLSDKHRFFCKGWNVFDFVVVAVAFIPGNGTFSILRAFRSFRALRLLYRIPRLRVITESLFSSIPSIGWICFLISIWFYICSVISTSLFGEKFPDWFGNIGKSMYTLFQIMTLESWSMGIVRPVMEAFPYAWLMFIPFIVFATYTVMNLFIGIMVNAISEAQTKKDDAAAPHEDPNAAILRELRELRAEIGALKEENAAVKSLLAAGKNGHED